MRTFTISKIKEHFKNVLFRDLHFIIHFIFLLNLVITKTRKLKP
jgi:hypothetical protein